jgi:isoleucyl-tRNA synthetase
MMRRTPEVIDTWFDSGSMPFAQWHYPFENRDVTERHYPADFIAEGVDQTRGWFYSLLAIATGLGDALPNNGGAAGSSRVDTIAAPYRAVVVNDLVLDANGVKMSKSRGNAVDPWAVIARHGADAVRLFLIASSQVWLPRRFDEEAIRETAGRFLLTLRNTYQFFAQYAAFGWSPNLGTPAPASRPSVDRWVLSRLARVERDVDALLARYEATAAARLIMDFVVDDVSNWYVRLTRGRFYDVESADSRAAFATLYEVLVVTCRCLRRSRPSSRIGCIASSPASRRTCRHSRAASAMRWSWTSRSSSGWRRSARSRRWGVRRAKWRTSRFASPFRGWYVLCQITRLLCWTPWFHCWRRS